MWGQTDGDLELSSCMTQASPPRAIQYTQRAVYVSCIVSSSSETSPRQRGLRWLHRLGGPERCRITAPPGPPVNTAAHGSHRNGEGFACSSRCLCLTWSWVSRISHFPLVLILRGRKGAGAFRSRLGGETEDIRTSHPLEAGANKEKGWKSHKWQPNMRKRRGKVSAFGHFLI